MYRLFFSILFCAGLTFHAQAQAVNAANYRVPGMPGAGVAQGSIFILYGTFLGPGSLVQANSLPLPITLGDTSVTVTVGAVTLNCYMIYSSADQVAMVLPSNTPVGGGSVTLTYIGRTSNAIAIQVVASSFGTFSLNQAGYGPGVIQNYDSAGNPSTNTINNAAQPGQTVVIWGTGLGPISGSDATTPPVGNLSTTVLVYIGGQAATILYQGRSGYPGVDQINVTVPTGVTGCYVPVEVSAAGIVANFTTMSIAKSGGTCSDTVSLAAQDINTAVKNGQSNIGLIAITDVTSVADTTSTTISAGYQIDLGSAQFEHRTLSALQNLRGVNYPIAALGTCTAVTFQLNPNFTDVLDPGDPAAVSYLNAGLAIEFQGPVDTENLGLNRSGFYSGVIGGGLSGSATLPVFVMPGGFALLGGRSDEPVQPFQTTLQIPDEPTWTNETTAGSVTRTTPLQITWTGGDATQEVAIVLGESTDTTGLIRGVFTCTADLSTGTLTVPADVMSVLPASGTSALLEFGTLTRTDVGRLTSTPPGLDGAYFQIERTTRIAATYQ
jgi:uncharacterized protein (TIGR03437 family)